MNMSIKTYVFDVDGTICSLTNGEYAKAEPISERIELINTLFEKGHTIIFYSARGMGRHKNNAEKAIIQFYDLTLKQLETWGVKYHGLFLGKPAGDFYIDDKAIHDLQFFKSENNSNS
jgi:capsule biosynthesis phosphatase